MTNQLNLIIFISGHGSNLKNILQAIEDKRLNARIQCVVSNKENAYGLTVAQKYNIPTIIIPCRKLPKDLNDPLRIEYDMQIHNLIKHYPIDFICLAGFMHILGKEFLNFWPNKVINIHPSLLPSFKGAHAQKDAYNAKVKIIGASVHYVIFETDAGEIIAQGVITTENCTTEDDFIKQILKVEYYLYIYALNKLIDNSGAKLKRIEAEAYKEKILIF